MEISEFMSSGNEQVRLGQFAFPVSFSHRLAVLDHASEGGALIWASRERNANQNEFPAKRQRKSLIGGGIS